MPPATPARTRKTPLHLALALAFAASTCTPFAADLSVTTRIVELPEIGPVTNWLLHTDRATFAFMPPGHWTFEPQIGESRLVWVAPNYSLLTVRTGAPDLISLNPTNHVELQEHLAKTYPEAVIGPKVSFYTEAEPGIAFDLSVQDDHGVDLRTRIGIARIHNVIFEFSLTATPERFAGALPTFTGFLTSFQALPRPYPR